MSIARFKHIAAAGAAGLILAACATPTPYKAADGNRDFGYSETRIETGKYRVTFRGNTNTDLSTVENYILLRAAELAVADGFGHFMILDDSESGRRSFNSFTSGFGGGVGGFGRANSFGGFGGFGSASTRTNERRSYQINALIQAFPGEKDEDDLSAFNASDVITNLGPVAAAG